MNDYRYFRLAVASKRCNNVVIQNNEVYRNGNAGIMLHRSSDHGIVSGNEVYRNGDAGLALFASSHAQVYNNYFYRNKCKSQGKRAAIRSDIVVSRLLLLSR